jgi:hypothetical protein
MGKMRRANKISVGKPEGITQLGIPRLRWEDNIRMDHKETGCEVVDWIHKAHDREQWRALRVH